MNNDLSIKPDAKDDLTDQITALSPAKRTLLELRLKKGADASGEQAIPRRANRNWATLSFAQQRLWFLDQLEPNSPLYNMTRVIRIRGALNVKALQKTLDAIVDRHSVLRTTFAVVGGSPVQVIAESSEVELPSVDLSEWSDAERETEVQRFLKEEAQRPFNLSHDLMLRTTLLRLGEEEHVLLLVMHHIASDGWSMGVLFRELSALYEAFSTGSPSPLPELPIQYADFAVWQRQWLQGEVLEAQLVYWKQQLDGTPPLLELPTDYPRPPVQTYRGVRQSLVLSKTLTGALKELSQQEGVTLFMTLLAAFKTLLYRYTRQEDILVGTPIANRNRAEIEGLIGFFVNTLVLRTDLSGNPSFRELLARVRKVALGAYDHQDLPFEKLVEELQPERNMSSTPLFQVMFALQNAPMSALELSGLRLSPMEVDSQTAKFDLTLFMWEGAEGLRARLEYNTDLFDAATIRRMLGHFQTLLEGIVADPKQRLWELPLVTDAERHQLLVEWNDTKTEYPQGQCIHQLFEAQVERTPDAVAVIFEQERLTYRELNHRANQVAHHLQKLGVGPEVLVGICIERSLEMVVGLLGILKAGGAYVPMDPMYPQERLAFMIEDAFVPVLLTQQRLVSGLPESGAKVVCLDSGWEVIAPQSQENPASEVTPDNLAYVIYTSGSTGKPKGVAVPHRAVNRLVFNTNYVKLEPDDRVAQASNACFDAATFEIWGALLHGARLVGIAKDVTLSPQKFAAHIREQQISVLFLTTALFNQLASVVPWAFNSVRYLLFGGEAVDPRSVKEVLKNSPPQRLLHVYGPTESTTFSSWHLVQEIPEGATTLPIGRPISNTQIYLLDHNLQPVPVGVPGELYIGGDGLARGYRNRPELTAFKFIPNRFSSEPGARLYKTGDNARYLPDGNIEFLGRIDHQVKIRGFRIELGEVEAVLSQHPDVRETVVIAWEDYPGDKRLVAYVVPNQEQVPTISDLHRFLKQKLPDYMVPSAFVILDTLPLTPNGKVDRRVLPVPDWEKLKSEAAIVRPSTLVEVVMAGIWAEVLGLEQVGIHDDFFTMGGHSLLAIQLISRMHDAFGVELPLRCLFETPTVAGLAKQVEVERQAHSFNYQAQSKQFSSLLAIQPGGSTRPFFLVPGGNGGEGELLVYARLARYLGVEQPFYGLKAYGLDKAQPTHTKIKALAANYVREIQTLQPEGPYLLGGECVGGIVAFEMAQQLQAQGQDIALLALLDTKRPSNIRYLRFLVKKFLLPPRHLLSRAIYHLSNLRHLKSREQLPYIFDKAKKAIDSNTFVFNFNAQEQVTDRNHSTQLNYAETLLRYRPKNYPGRLTLLVSEEFYRQEPTMGWGDLAGGGLEIHMLPGNHYSYIREHAQATAKQLKACLNNSQVDI